MTLGECIQRADALRPNAATEEEKVRWVLEVEQELRRDFFPKYQGPVPETQTDGRATPLLASGPFEGLYVYRLLAQLELMDREWESYAAYQALANQTLSAFKKAWHRTHRLRRGGGRTCICL